MQNTAYFGRMVAYPSERIRSSLSRMPRSVRPKALRDTITRAAAPSSTAASTYQ
jgi:hypothetical protein